jgi:hypothetical protein
MRSEQKRWTFFALLLTAMMLGLAACSVDPGEDVEHVTIINDGAVPVTVKQCGDTCATTYDKAHLRPGESVTVNGCVQCALEQYWSVTDDSGHVQGCVDLNFQARQSDARVHLSKLVRCGHA